MIVVSNHLFATTNLAFPKDIVVRVNIAWMKDKANAIATLKRIKHDVYLDYPHGRSKPPKPTEFTLKDAVEIAASFGHVKYFAMSNVEDARTAEGVRRLLPERIEFVPKIETQRGVNNFSRIIRAGRARHAMLDKQDLYLNVSADHRLFEKLVKAVRSQAKKSRITLLELQGVVFA